MEKYCEAVIWVHSGKLCIRSAGMKNIDKRFSQEELAVAYAEPKDSLKYREVRQ